MKKNKIEKYMESLTPEVRNVIDKVLEAELERLNMQKPKGIKDEIKRFIHEEIKQRAT